MTLTLPDERWALTARRLLLGGVPVPPPAIPIPERLNGMIRDHHDGDTIYADVHLVGQNFEERQPIRLLGSNAAELKTPGGDAAASNMLTLLTVGTPVVLSEIGTDKYAPRWDCAVSFLLDGDPTDLVTYLVAQQWLAPWNGVGKKPVPPWPRTVT